jgi:preprotein translocase subunit SecG
MGGLMSARGATNFLTRLTAILATLFMGISLVLAMLAGSVATETGSVMDNARTPAQDAPAATPAPAPGAETAPAQPEEPAAPAVPFSE